MWKHKNVKDACVGTLFPQLNHINRSGVFPFISAMQEVTRNVCDSTEEMKYRRTRLLRIILRFYVYTFYLLTLIRKSEYKITKSVFYRWVRFLMSLAPREKQETATVIFVLTTKSLSFQWNNYSKNTLLRHSRAFPVQFRSAPHTRWTSPLAIS